MLLFLNEYSYRVWGYLVFFFKVVKCYIYIFIGIIYYLVLSGMIILMMVFLIYLDKILFLYGNVIKLVENIVSSLEEGKN